MLRLHYNHRDQKNHTKFSAKTSSHWPEGFSHSLALYPARLKRFLFPLLPVFPRPTMSGHPTPLVPTGPGPQRTTSSRNSVRFNPIGSRPSTPLLAPSHVDQSIHSSAAEAAESLLLDPATFPTLFTPPSFSDDLSDGERRILPVLAALVTKVHLLTSEMALLKPNASPPPIPAASQADSLITAALWDLSSKVTSLAARPPPVPCAPCGSVPPPLPPPEKNPLLNLFRQGNLTAPSANFSILVSGQWYGSPETYVRDNKDFREANIFFASVNPSSGKPRKSPKRNGSALQSVST